MSGPCSISPAVPFCICNNNVSQFPTDEVLCAVKALPTRRGLVDATKIQRVAKKTIHITKEVLGLVSSSGSHLQTQLSTLRNWQTLLHNFSHRLTVKPCLALLEEAKNSQKSNYYPGMLIAVYHFQRVRITRARRSKGSADVNKRLKKCPIR